MWTRLYLALLLVRLYFAFSPSYIHPDENFQGPEVVAGELVSSEEVPVNALTQVQETSSPIRTIRPGNSIRPSQSALSSPFSLSTLSLSTSYTIYGQVSILRLCRHGSPSMSSAR